MFASLGVRLVDGQSGASPDVSRSYPAAIGTTIALLVCGIAAPLVFIPFVIWAGIVTPSYNHISSTFSDSAAQGQPYPEIIGAGLVLLAVMLGCYAVGLGRVMPRCGGVTQAILVGAAGSIAGTGIFQDHNRSPFVQRNLEGSTHNAFAMAAIFCIIGTIGVTAYAVRGQPEWDYLSSPAVAVLILTAIAGIGFLYVGDGRDGIAERMFAGFASIWLVIMAINAIRVISDRSGVESTWASILALFRPGSPLSLLPIDERERGPDR